MRYFIRPWNDDTLALMNADGRVVFVCDRFEDLLENCGEMLVVTRDTDRPGPDELPGLPDSRAA